jgi:predicted transcriptional regulator
MMPVVCRTMHRQSVAPIGEQIRARREELGLSRIGLAYKASVNLRTIERVEEGAVTPRPATLTVIEQALEALEAELEAAA